MDLVYQCGSCDWFECLWGGIEGVGGVLKCCMGWMDRAFLQLCAKWAGKRRCSALEDDCLFYSTRERVEGFVIGKLDMVVLQLQGDLRFFTDTVHPNLKEVTK